MNLLKSTLAAILPERGLLHLRAADHYLNGEHELRLLPVICPTGRAAIDAGANIGSYCYFLRRHASKVYAYEPNPELARRLTQLMPDVDVRNVALSDKSMDLVLHVPTDAAGRAHHELGSVVTEADGPMTEYRVKGITIDSEQLADVGFIKIDVERHEREVLRGALTTIARCRPVMLVEVYPLQYRQSLQETFAFITDLGYSAWFFLDGRWLPLASLDPATHTHSANFGDPKRFIGNNLLFFPSEHRCATTGPRA